MTIDTILHPKTVTQSEVNAALLYAVAVTEAVRAAGNDGIPSGTLYAMLMSKLSLQAYESLIKTLVNTGLVSNQAHLLKWTGPKF